MNLNTLFETDTHKIESFGVRSTAPVQRLITVNSFLIRIDPESVAIDLASLDDPAADMATRTLQAQLRKFMRYIDNAPYVDLDLPQLIDGLNDLVTFGILTAARRDIILNAPVTSTEAF